MLRTNHPRNLAPAAKVHLDELLEEALQETFPASDPIAVAVELEFSAPGSNAKRRGARRAGHAHGTTSD